VLRSLTPSDVHNVQTWSLSNVIFPFDFVLLLLLFIQSFTLVETELFSVRRGEQNDARWSGVGCRSIEAMPKRDGSSRSRPKKRRVEPLKAQKETGRAAQGPKRDGSSRSRPKKRRVEPLKMGSVPKALPLCLFPDVINLQGEPRL
jgi:hypothetical protein